jgi:hypothetical protein
MSIGFEYCIRQFDLSKVNKAIEISSDYLDTFLTIDTEVFTKVDEGALMRIWVAKIKDQDKRQFEVAKKLMENYDKMTDIIAQELDDAAGSINRLENVMIHLNGIK